MPVWHDKVLCCFNIFDDVENVVNFSNIFVASNVHGSFGKPKKLSIKISLSKSPLILA